MTGCRCRHFSLVWGQATPTFLSDGSPSLWLAWCWEPLGFVFLYSLGGGGDCRLEPQVLFSPFARRAREPPPVFSSDLRPSSGRAFRLLG